MQRRGTIGVAAVSAAVAAVVSVATTLVVLRVTDPEPVRPLASVGPPASSATSGAAAPAAGGAVDLAALFARVSSGVVRIETTACVLGAAGTGFLVAPDLVTTAAHVVDGAHAIVLRRDDGTGVAGQVIGIDTVHDVALVRADRRLDGHVFAFAAALPAVGADVAALGYPLAGPLVPVRRTVSGLAQSLDVSGRAGGRGAATSEAGTRAAGTRAAGTADGGPDGVIGDLIRLDGGFDAGASGGPVLAADGRVVGVVEGRAAAGGGNTGYAVAAVQAAALVAQWRVQTTPLDVSDSCSVPVGPPQSRVVVRDESGSGLGPLVTAFLGSYASAINSGRYELAWGMLTRTARAGRTLAEWTEAERSSQLFDVVVRRVDVVTVGASPTTVAPARPAATSPPTGASSRGPTTGATDATGPTRPTATGTTRPAAPVVTPGAGGRLDALVEFSSTQENRLGPGGQTCSRWRVTYALVRSATAWQIDAAVLEPGYPQSC